MLTATAAQNLSIIFGTYQQPAEARMLAQLEHCLHRGCVIAIEHTARVEPRYTRWELWGRPQLYGGDLSSIYTEIDRCRRTHCDHYIRLSVEDLSWRSRLSVMVHRPH